MDRGLLSWIIFAGLCFIWGSSFILMKQSLEVLGSFEVASLRIASAGLVLTPFFINSWRRIPRGKILLVFVSGLMGSLFPAYFFCVAQEHVESSLAGSLNALTPIFVIVLGALFFRTRTATGQVLGILLSFCGSILLYAGHSGFSIDSGIFYAFLILLATLAYGINVNLVNRYLTGISSADIAVVAIVLIAIPASIVLGFTDFFGRDAGNPGYQEAVFYTILLGVLGTSLASVIFYMLIKRSGPVFSSMVTYGIPVVANFWGFVFGERVGLWQILCLGLILAGVFLATRKPKSAPSA